MAVPLENIYIYAEFITKDKKYYIPFSTTTKSEAVQCFQIILARIIWRFTRTRVTDEA